MTYYINYFVFILLFSLIHMAQSRVNRIKNGASKKDLEPDCINPIKELGYCIELPKCESLFKILSDYPLKARSVIFLQKSTCGFIRDTPKVCCVDEDDIANYKNGGKGQIGTENSKNDGRRPIGSNNSNGGRRPIGSNSNEGRRPIGSNSNEGRRPIGSNSNEGRRPIGSNSNERRPIGSNSNEGRRPIGSDKNPDDETKKDTEIGGGGATIRAAFDMSESLRSRVLRHPNLWMLPGIRNCGKGKSTDRIVGGINAEIGQFPWMALIAFGSDDPEEPVQFACGGTLIAKNYVLTASHCVVNLPEGYKVKYVRIGEYDQSKTKDCVERTCSPPVQDVPVDSIISHEKYDITKKKENDIALLKLSKPVEIREFSSPICLPFSLELKEGKVPPSVLKIKDLTAAGWGRTKWDEQAGSDILQKVQLPIVSIEECNNYYTNKVKLGGIDDSRFCSGAKENADSCRGDSGGPLMETILVADPDNPRKYISRTYQFGVVSLGPTKCGSRGHPGLYTKVSHFLPWILDNMKSY